MTCPHLWNQTSALLDHPGPAVWIELNFAFLKGSQYGRIIPETSRISQPESLCWDLQCLAGRECRRSPREGCRNIQCTSSPRQACPVKDQMWAHSAQMVLEKVKLIIAHIQKCSLHPEWRCGKSSSSSQGTALPRFQPTTGEVLHTLIILTITFCVENSYFWSWHWTAYLVLDRSFGRPFFNTVEQFPPQLSHGV